jgi:hypothetical protein
MSFIEDAGPALVGSLVGAGITCLAQWQIFNQQERIRKALAREAASKAETLRKETESIHAFSMFLKLNRIVTDLTDMRNSLHDAKIRALRDGGSMAAALRPFSTDPDKQGFSIEELLLVRALRRDDLLNIVTDLPAVHASYVDNIVVIRNLRTGWAELADEQELHVGGVVLTKFSGTKGEKARINLMQADELANVLWCRSWEDVPRTTNLFADLQDAIIDRLGSDIVRVKFAIGRLPEAPPPDRGRRGSKPAGMRSPSAHPPTDPRPRP